MRGSSVLLDALVVEPSGGGENPASVVRLMEVCRWCPVRRECLEDSLEPTWTTVGCFGGSVKTERTTMRTVVVEDLSTAEAVTWTFQQSLSKSFMVSSDMGRHDRSYQDDGAVVKGAPRTARSVLRTLPRPRTALYGAGNAK